VDTKLFVAVLAIDPRYVTLSLEKHYNGILKQSSPPTGMDFLEKIIQIPFRLPGVQNDNVDEFLDNEIDAEEEEPQKAPKTGTESIDESASDYEFEEPDFPTFKALGIPSNKILFTVEEKNMMRVIFKLVRVEPRCMRRIINVFKQLKVIWIRDPSRFPMDNNKDLKTATLLIMLLASNVSTRDAAYTIFDWMEMGAVKYHEVVIDINGRSIPTNNLADLFKIEMQKRNQRFVVMTDENKIREGTLMFYIDIYLAKYAWSSVDEWNQVASQFLLARCFSFFRLVAADMEEKQKILENNYMMRLMATETNSKQQNVFEAADSTYKNPVHPVDNGESDAVDDASPV
jgi:hypothetical protein